MITKLGPRWRHAGGPVRLLSAIKHLAQDAYDENVHSVSPKVFATNAVEIIESCARIETYLYKGNRRAAAVMYAAGLDIHHGICAMPAALVVAKEFQCDRELLREVSKAIKEQVALLGCKNYYTVKHRPCGVQIHQLRKL